MDQPPAPPRIDRRRDTILRLPEVMARTGIRRTTLYRRMAEGTFPKSIALGGNCTGWYQSDVEDWIVSPATYRAS